MVLVFDDLGDLGNDIATALDFDPVADAEAHSLDPVGIVQGGAADGDAADKDRIEHRGRRQLSAAPHGDHDVMHLRDGLFGGELVGDGPARRSPGVAETLLRRMRIHLDYDSVNVITQSGALLFGCVDELHHVWNVVHLAAMRVNAESERSECVECRLLSGGKVLAINKKKVGKEDQPPACHDAGIHGAHRSGSGIAWIHEGRQSLALTLLVGAFERLFRHHHLAADFESLDRKSTRLNSSHSSISYAV